MKIYDVIMYNSQVDPIFSRLGIPLDRESQNDTSHKASLRSLVWQHWLTFRITPWDWNMICLHENPQFSKHSELWEETHIVVIAFFVYFSLREVFGEYDS